MMLKGIFSISLVALLLAVVTFAALEVWIEIHARERHYEISRGEEPPRPMIRPVGAETSSNQ